MTGVTGHFDVLPHKKAEDGWGCVAVLISYTQWAPPRWQGLSSGFDFLSTKGPPSWRYVAPLFFSLRWALCSNFDCLPMARPPGWPGPTERHAAAQGEGMPQRAVAGGFRKPRYFLLPGSLHSGAPTPPLSCLCCALRGRGVLCLQSEAANTASPRTIRAVRRPSSMKIQHPRASPKAPGGLLLGSIFEAHSDWRMCHEGHARACPPLLPTKPPFVRPIGDGVPLPLLLPSQGRRCHPFRPCA